MYKISFIFLCFYLFSCSRINAQERFGQSEDYSNLLQSMKSIQMVDGNGINHNWPEQRGEIDAKLNYAQTYLTIELANLTLSDSSDYYEKKLKELKELEGKKLKGKDSIILLNEKEKLYLLTSILKPMRSDTSLFELMKIWYEVSVPVSFTLAQECTINYKIWLYELSENRFRKEKEAKYFTKRKEIMYLKKARCYSELPYNSITEEKLIISKAEQLISLSKNDSLKYDFYNRRALKLNASNLKNKADSLTNYIEQLLLKSYNLKPKDYHINYDLFAFYYNEGAILMRSIEYDSSEKELSEIKKKQKYILRRHCFMLKKLA